MRNNNNKILSFYQRTILDTTSGALLRLGVRNYKNGIIMSLMNKFNKKETAPKTLLNKLKYFLLGKGIDFNECSTTIKSFN